MSDDLIKDVAGLKVQMEMMIGLLKDIQKELRYNHMPSAQIEEKFKNQGERLGSIESDHETYKARMEKEILMIKLELEKKLEELDADTFRRFNQIAKDNAQALKDKRNHPYKLMGATAVLVTIIGSVVSGVAWALQHIK